MKLRSISSWGRSSAAGTSRGFTLIELLVVLSIIGLLSSIILATVSSARTRTRDARKIADFGSISLALQLFYDVNQRMPSNYNPGLGACEGQSAYDQSMGELVDGGFLAAIPRSPGGGNYCYYDYGAGNGIGALIVTTLEAAAATTTGVPPSCRPWAPGTNWCNQSSNKQYCICNRY